MNDTTELTKENLKDIRKILEKIEAISSDGDYIYRGERKHHEKVSSTLYRKYEKEIKAEKFYINIVEKDMLEEAKSYTTEDDQSILTSLQHYGGKTNLIDFSRDYRVALYFACDDEFKENGRMILVNTKEVLKDEVISPRSKINRVIAQNSVFIKPAKGFLQNPGDPIIVIDVPKEIKKAILEYLRKYHDIYSATVFNDLHGFIERQKAHQSAYTEFFKGLTRHDAGKFKAAIRCYNKAIKLNPQYANSYVNRGISHAALKEYPQAIADFTKAIELNPKHAQAYTNRGASYGACKQHPQAIADCSRAIKLNPRLAQPYSNRGGSHLDLGENYRARGDERRALHEYLQAIADCTRAIELKPELADLYANRGAGRGALSEYPQAIADFTRAITINPKLAKAYAGRGRAKYEYNEQPGWDDDLGTALDDLRTALSLAKEQGDVGFERVIRQMMRDVGMPEPE